PVPAESSRGALLYPACDADRSSGPNRGALYCSWMDLTAAGDIDTFVSRSANSGATWSAPQRVSDDASGALNDQFNQWLAVDPTDGSVDVSWSDTRNDPMRLSTDEYFTRSTDGGHTYIANVRVSAASTNETCCGADLGDQYGDYEGIAAYGGVIHPIWTDRRLGGTVDGYEETYTAAITTK
ncbi:MAG TPA: sialidase family protein, partial [Ktedonobacterales bacterium]|nr:sialidase family protein [Ktedonobacterales bacterium]